MFLQWNVGILAKKVQRIWVQERGQQWEEGSFSRQHRTIRHPKRARLQGISSGVVVEVAGIRHAEIKGVGALRGLN